LSTSLDVLGGLAGGSAYKTPVAVATTTDLTGKMIGLLTIDGYVLQPNDRVLVRDNVDQTTNGIYTANLSAWVRSIDFSNSSAIAAGTQVFVVNGATYGGTSFSLTTPGQPGTIVIGTANITFTQNPSTVSITQLPITPGQGKRALISLGYNLATVAAMVPPDVTNPTNFAWNDAFWPIGGAAWALIQAAYGLAPSQLALIQSTAETNR
jgi:phage-related tail fiber protein